MRRRGQGAAMTLEDAVVLSKIFTPSSSSESQQPIYIDSALAKYVSLRYERTAQLKAMARHLGSAYTLPEDFAPAEEHQDDKEDLSSAQKDLVRKNISTNPFANPHIGALLFGYDAENVSAAGDS